MEPALGEIARAACYADLKELGFELRGSFSAVWTADSRNFKSEKSCLVRRHGVRRSFPPSHVFRSSAKRSYVLVQSWPELGSTNPTFLPTRGLPSRCLPSRVVRIGHHAVK